MRYLKSYQKFEAVSAPEPTPEELEKILAEIAKEEKLDPKKVITGAQKIAEETPESPKVNEEIIGVGVGLLMIAGVAALVGASIKVAVTKEFNDYAKKAAEKQIAELQKNPEFKGDPKKLIKTAYQNLKKDKEFKSQYDKMQGAYGGKGGAGSATSINR